MPSSLVLYVGINKPFVFDKFTSIFHRLLSTSTSRPALQQFSQGRGVILTLKSGTSQRLHYAKPPKYLAVSWLSDFPNESQYILYGSHNLLEITDIIEAEYIIEADTMKSHKLELE
eukprot:500388_1